MVPTVFDKAQAWARKSIFCVKSYKNVAPNHLELIRDKSKILFGTENSGLKDRPVIQPLKWGELLSKVWIW